MGHSYAAHMVWVIAWSGDPVYMYLPSTQAVEISYIL